MYDQQAQQQPLNQAHYQVDQTQQPPRGWWRRNWRWFVPVGSVVFVLGGVGFFIAIFALVFGLMKSTEVYETALFEAFRDDIGRDIPVDVARERFDVLRRVHVDPVTSPSR